MARACRKVRGGKGSVLVGTNGIPKLLPALKKKSRLSRERVGKLPNVSGKMKSAY